MCIGLPGNAGVMFFGFIISAISEALEVRDLQHCINRRLYVGVRVCLGAEVHE